MGCIASTSGVTEGCANCFGQVAQCTLKNCAVKCLVDPTAPACVACGHKYCDELGKTCTGLPVSPDPKNCDKASAASVVLAAVPATNEKAKAVVGSPSVTGACTADDGTKTKSTKFSCASIACAKKNFFRLDATAKCIASTSGVTEGCANCFGQVAQCTLKNCAVKCLVDPTAPACVACGHKYCDELGKTCTGLPVSPDPKNCDKASAASVVLAAVPATNEKAKAVVGSPSVTGACTADDGTKTKSTKFSCASIACAKKNFFRLDATAKCIASTSGVTEGCANCVGQVA